MATLDANTWINAASRELAAGGHDAVRVEVLARNLGVTKGSFYWHFPNRRALLDALLERWEREGTERIIEHVNAAAQDPLGRLRTLMQMATEASLPAAVDVRLRAWGAVDAEVGQTIRRVDTRRVMFVAGLLRELGIPGPTARLRSMALYRTLIGEYMVRSIDTPPASRPMIEELLSVFTAR